MVPRLRLRAPPLARRTARRTARHRHQLTRPPAGRGGHLGGRRLRRRARHLGQQLTGDHHDGAGAPVGRGPQVHPDAVAAGQPADHEQAQPVGVGQVEGLLDLQPFVDLGQRLLAQSKAPVVDLQREAVRDHLALHRHLGVRRREDRRVLDQLGDQVGDVGDRAAQQTGAGEGPDHDPCVVLHLGDGRADHVDHPDRLAPGPAGRAAGEDDQTLGVAAHTGRQVVQPEEVLQLGRVLGAPLHGVQQGQLAVQQHLAAPGQVDEDRRDATAQLGLLDGGLHGGALHGAERAAELADLRLTELQVGALDGDVHHRAAPQPLHHRGQPDAGQLVGGVAQADQLAGHAAADPVGDHQRQDDRGQAHQAGDQAAPEQAHRLGGGLGPRFGGQLGVEVGRVGQHLGGVAVPAGRADAVDRGHRVAGGLEEPFGQAQRGPGRAGQQAGVPLLVRLPQLADVDREERLLVVHRVEHRLVLGVGGGGAGLQAGHRRVLLREVLAGPGQLDEDRSLPGQLAALLADEGGPEGEGGLHQVGVPAEHRLPGHRVLADLAAQRGQLGRRGQHVLQPGALGRVEAVGVRAARPGLQAEHLGVGDRLGPLVGIRDARAARAYRPVDGGQPLALQVAGELVHRDAEALVGGGGVELAPEVAGGDHRRVDPQAHQRDDGHQEQRDDPRADRAAAQTHEVLGRECQGRTVRPVRASGAYDGLDVRRTERRADRAGYGGAAGRQTAGPGRGRPADGSARAYYSLRTRSKGEPDRYRRTVGRRMMTGTSGP